MYKIDLRGIHQNNAFRRVIRANGYRRTQYAYKKYVYNQGYPIKVLSRFTSNDTNLDMLFMFHASEFDIVENPANVRSFTAPTPPPMNIAHVRFNSGIYHPTDSQINNLVNWHFRNLHIYPSQVITQHKEYSRGLWVMVIYANYAVVISGNFNGIRLDHHQLLLAAVYKLAGQENPSFGAGLGQNPINIPINKFQKLYSICRKVEKMIEDGLIDETNIFEK